MHKPEAPVVAESGAHGVAASVTRMEPNGRLVPHQPAWVNHLLTQLLTMTEGVR